MFQLITVQHSVYKANLIVTVSNKDMHYWKYFNSNEVMTKGEPMELERTVSISIIFGGGYLYKVGCEIFYGRLLFSPPFSYFWDAYSPHPSLRWASVLFFICILTPTTLSAIPAPIPTPSHFSLHLCLISAHLFIFRSVRNIANSGYKLNDICLSVCPHG